MSRVNAKKLGLLAASAALLALFAVPGCGSSSDNQATPMAGSSAAGKSGAGTGGKSSAGAAGKTSTAGTGGTDIAKGGSGNDNAGGDANEGGMGGEGNTMNCDGPKGCYSCAPKTNIEFLNHCVEGGCPATFDNSTLTKLGMVGKL